MKEELLKCLKAFDIPAFRKHKLNANNLRWLLRNISIRNANHPRLSRALELIKEGIQQGGFH